MSRSVGCGFASLRSPAARVASIGQALGVPICPPDALAVTTSLPIERVIATAAGAIVTAPPGPRTVPIGVVSLGDPTDQEMWAAWRAVDDAHVAPLTR